MIKAPTVRTGPRGFLRRLACAGTRRRCPICGAGCRRFRGGGRLNATIENHRIIGAGYHPDHRCPVCRSTRRERLVFLYLMRRTSILDGRTRRLLHVAPEHRIASALAKVPGLSYLSADLEGSRAMVPIDITAMTFGDGEFDAIVCNHVLEHLHDDRRAMTELFRVLKPGGFAILQVPFSANLAATHEDPTVTSPEEREREFGQRDHVRIYAHDDYLARLVRAGFAVEEFHWRDQDDFGGGANLCGLDVDEPVFVCRHPAEAPRHGVPDPDLLQQ